MKKIVFFVFVSLFLLASCTTYLSIPNISKQYPPAQFAIIVETVPDAAVYIGKLKVVPSDNNMSVSFAKAKMILLKNAAKYGANYVYIKEIGMPSSDFQGIRWDASYGDGATIEAELYR